MFVLLLGRFKGAQGVVLTLAPLIRPKDRAKHITAYGHGMRKHSRKSFWFFFFRKRTVPAGRPQNTNNKKRAIYFSNNMRGSVIHPVTAAAAATSGEAKSVLAPGPCRPSKFRFDVETAYFPAGTLSAFIAKQAEQPGWRSSNPASRRISSSPSSRTKRSTICDPGTNHAVTPGAFLRPLTA